MTSLLLFASAGVPASAPAAPTEYVELSDGSRIAVNVRMPDDFVEGRRYPVILEMSGYDSGSSDGRTPAGEIEGAAGVPEGTLPMQSPTRNAARTLSRFYKDYVTVTANLRGSGCSTGEFDLFSWNSALDGREVVEWLADRTWSDGKVGIYGHSHSGITGFMVAATRPPSLAAVTVSGVIGDLYRSISYPGGVPNTGQILAWTYGLRPGHDLLNGVGDGVVDEGRRGQTECLRNQAERSYPVTRDPLVNGNPATARLDNEWFSSRSLRTYAARINVPIHLTGTAQDRQVNPHSAPLLFDLLSPDVPRRLVYFNGGHDTENRADFIRDERLAWMDHWMRGVKTPGWTADPSRRASSKVFLEVQGGDEQAVPNGWFESDGFPFTQTRWRELYLRAHGRAAFAPPRRGEGSTRYVSGSKRQSYAGREVGMNTGGELTALDGPDEAQFKTPPLSSDLVVAGPVTATLYMSSTATDTDVQVQVLDEGPGGEVQWVSRGFLRASHRAVTKDRSFFTADGRMYRPWHPHTKERPLAPGRVHKLPVEVLPASHVFRKGHRIVIKIHSPALSDDDYSFALGTPPSLNAVRHRAGHASRLLVPTISLDGVDSLGAAPAPCTLTNVRCVRPVGARGASREDGS